MRRLFKNKLFIFCLVTILILIAMGVSSRQDSRLNWLGGVVNAVISPVQGLFSISGQKVQSGLSFFQDIKAIKKENEELKARIDELEKDKMELEGFRSENAELRQALNLKDQFSDYDFVGANVIAKDPGNWFNVFTIDVGNKDGISNKFPVVTSKGLVGSVDSVGLFSSKVTSIIDMDSTISGRISKTRDIVRIKGDITLKDQGLCKMDYIPPEVDLAVGDTVETSGLGGIFPKGIVIGKVKEIRQTNNELTRYAIIEPAIDFKRLEQVFVLKSKNNVEMEGSTK